MIGWSICHLSLSLHRKLKKFRRPNHNKEISRLSAGGQEHWCVSDWKSSIFTGTREIRKALPHAQLHPAAVQTHRWKRRVWTDVSHMSFVLDLVKAVADIRCVVLLHRFLTFGSAGTNKTPHPALRSVFTGWHRSALAPHLESVQILWLLPEVEINSVLVEYIIRMDSCTWTTEHLKITVCGRFNLKCVRAEMFVCWTETRQNKEF